ncbi:response regulator transcription factor [Cetobacterium sp. 2A]|uniref:LytR/AlgR family response regulator transcription factor n=1 Tax=Cetobacterium sp. 2A TaxID=2754723 RepID=UPI00163C8AE6|nr:LytTR family DNA-binding domain-containing protein [Cetobacterium sp. 2A]MBC2856788.1 response regulator transcription factor [Cetobacterium sp. 2A]
MLKCLIVEDEFPAREELKYFIKNHKGLDIDGEFENPLDALKYIQDHKVDVVFLDINMPELDGMSLGKILYKLDEEIKLVFITAYKDYAVDAFEIKAFDYLLKPYSEDRILEVLNSLVDQKQVEQIKTVSKVNKITVTSEDKMYVISIQEIYYIEASEKETLIHTKNRIYSSKIKISKFEEILPDEYFFRTHRSYIINLDKIIEIEPWFNTTYILKIMDLSFKIPVSRNNMKDLKELLLIK